ncbi:DUF7344 domain-containing protein [Halobaculum sp. EA56]|uniref:DUF7344 domain-containing protein n=1 Tax=Halobaculum sp. EA56 TaxID=3421648 RepID=UPI003EC0412A
MAEVSDAVTNGEQIGAVESEESTAEEPQQLDEPAERAEEELPLDVKFDILKNRRRRLVLKQLRQEEGKATIGDLAEQIAAVENDTTVQALNAQQRKRVYIGLYQCHLPKMDDAGVVDFEQSRGRIELTSQAEDLFEYMSLSEEDEGDERAFPSHGALLATAATVGGVFAVTQFLGYHLLASLVVFGFLAGVVAFAVAEGGEDDE